MSRVSCTLTRYIFGAEARMPWQTLNCVPFISQSEMNFLWRHELLLYFNSRLSLLNEELNINSACHARRTCKQSKDTTDFANSVVLNGSESTLAWFVLIWRQENHLSFVSHVPIAFFFQFQTGPKLSNLLFDGSCRAFRLTLWVFARVTLYGLFLNLRRKLTKGSGVWERDSTRLQRP